MATVLLDTLYVILRFSNSSNIGGTIKLVVVVDSHLQSVSFNLSEKPEDKVFPDLTKTRKLKGWLPELTGFVTMITQKISGLVFHHRPGDSGISLNHLGLSL